MGGEQVFALHIEPLQPFRLLRTDERGSSAPCELDIELQMPRAMRMPFICRGEPLERVLSNGLEQSVAIAGGVALDQRFLDEARE